MPTQEEFCLSRLILPEESSKPELKETISSHDRTSTDHARTNQRAGKANCGLSLNPRKTGHPKARPANTFDLPRVRNPPFPEKLVRHGTVLQLS